MENQTSTDNPIANAIEGIAKTFNLLQKQNEALARLVYAHHALLGALIGQTPADSEPRQLSERAKAEIAALERLFRAGDDERAPSA